MGIGHRQQFTFEKAHWKHRFSHGGILRHQRLGRKARPLSTKAAIHLVFKTDKSNMRRSLRSPLGFQIVQRIIKLYAKRFHIKISQQAVCSDHIHLLIRLPKRSMGPYFLRVVAGQIAQQFEKKGFLVTGTRSLWKYRPFTRVIQGWKAYLTVYAYVLLNEKEAQGAIQYKKQRLKGLSLSDWDLLWR